MCGLIGYVKNSQKHPARTPYAHAKNVTKLIRQGLYIDALRGHDSTGLACVPSIANKKPLVYKRALQALDFLGHPTVEKILKNVEDYKYILGHNRAATKGWVDDASAHPFQQGNIILTHNGTLHNETVLGGHNKFDVDSEALCYHLSEKGIEGMGEVDGAFALAWYDVQNDSVNFIRNNDRPLWFAVESEYNDIFYASELGMLEWLMQRNSLHIEASFYLKPGQHLRIKDDTNRMEVNEVELKKPTTYFGGRNSSGINTTDWYNKYYEQHKQGGSGNNHRNNRPTSEQQSAELRKKNEPIYQAQAEDWLAKNYNVMIGDKIEIEVDAFNRYYSKDDESVPRGDLFGRYESENGGSIMVAAFNVSRSTIEALDLTKPITAQIVGCAEMKVAEVNSQIAKNCVEKYGKEATPIGIRVSSSILEGTPIKKDNEKPGSKRALNRQKHNEDRIKAIECQKSSEYNKGGTPPKFFHINGSPIKSLNDIPTNEHQGNTYDQESNDAYPDAEDYMPGPGETLINIKRWHELTKEGCALCSCHLGEEEATSINWTPNSEPICPDCVEADDDEAYYYGGFVL